MSTRAWTVTEGFGWVVVFSSGLYAAETETGEATGAVAVASAIEGALLSFEQHLASLPTLQDLLGESRAMHTDFDALLEQARAARHRANLLAVRRGRMTRLMAERLRCGLTQTELAARAGMKQPNISRLEQPGVEMSVPTAKRLATALGLETYKDLLP